MVLLCLNAYYKSHNGCRVVHSGVAPIFFIDSVGLSMLSNDTKLIMASNLFCNGGFDLLLVYHAKAIVPATQAARLWQLAMQAGAIEAGTDCDC